VLVVDGAADAALLAELDDDVEVLEAGPGLPAARVAELVATRYAAGHGVVRIAAAATLAERARELEAGGVEFEVVPGVV